MSSLNQVLDIDNSNRPSSWKTITVAPQLPKLLKRYKRLYVKIEKAILREGF